VAPEIIELSESRHVEPQCDVFSAGVIFHILLTGKPLFQGTKYEEVYRNNKEMKVHLEGELYQRVDPLAMELLRAMLQPNPALRLTAEQALSHPYFAHCRPEIEGKVESPCLTESSRFNTNLPQQKPYK
jgi:serine/threonine protein kinase